MDMGFTAVGLDPVMTMGSFDPRQLSLQVLEEAEQLMAALREVASSKCDLMIKTHGQLTTSSAIRLARRMEKFAPHLYAGPIEAAANIQLSATLPNFLILESIDNFDGFFNDLLTTPIDWEEGSVNVPDRPGLGFELNEALAEAHPYHESSVFPPMAEVPL